MAPLFQVGVNYLEVPEADFRAVLEPEVNLLFRRKQLEHSLSPSSWVLTEASTFWADARDSWVHGEASDFIEFHKFLECLGKIAH